MNNNEWFMNGFCCHCIEYSHVTGGKDASSVGGLSSNQPKSYIHSDNQLPSKDQPDGEVINIMQDKEYENNGKNSSLYINYKQICII